MKAKITVLGAGLLLWALVNSSAQTPSQPRTLYRGPILHSVPDRERAAVQAEAQAEAPAAFVPANQVTNAGLRREVFLNIPGAMLGDLTNHARYPNQPDLVDTVSAFETPSNSGEDYGVRLSGFVVPAVNGSHKFYLSANGQAAFFLSLDEHPEHKRLIACEPVGNGPREWTNGQNQASRGGPPQNISPAINLVAGQAYYVEAIMKAGAGSDNLGVTWQRPGTAAPANGAAPIGFPGLALTPPATSLPTAGEVAPELAAFDYEVLKYMQRTGTKTATVGVMKDGRLMLKRGYGWRDRAHTEPMSADGRMRIASISKTFTAATIRRLIAGGRFSTNTMAFPYLGIQPFNGVWGDSRYTNVTVDHLLTHRGGWDNTVTGEPLDEINGISTVLGLDHPALPGEIISHELSRPLQFPPGSRQVYSNLGYEVLGQIIEKTLGKDFYSVVHREAIRPWGAKRIRVLRSPDKLREPDEPFYDDETLGINVIDFPTIEQIRIADGGNANLEDQVADGGLIASAEDLLRHAQGFHLGLTTTTAIGSNYASIGELRLTRKGIHSSHSGGYQGTTSYLEQRPDGVDWAVLFNKLANSSDGPEILGIGERAATNIMTWPGDNSTRIGLAADTLSVEENEGSLTIGVRRIGESTGVVSAAYMTVAGSASPGLEFMPVSGTLTFGSNEITRLITVPILDDAVAEPAKSFSLVLSAPTGGAGLGISSATITIEDDDNRQPPAVAITAPASGAVFTQGSNVAITASPIDSDGSIHTVKFFTGPTLIGEENKPPYTFVWKTPGPGTYALTARATDNDGLISTSPPVSVTVGRGLIASSPGTILREFWTRRPTNTVASVTNYVYFPDAPTGREYLDFFETSTNSGDYFGTHLQGWLHPPTTGQHVFWIAADHLAELWLSADEHPGNKVRIAAVSSPVSPRSWTAQAGQQSTTIPLVAGHRYYIEALHKEETSTDHLAVGWQLPDGTLERPIPGTRLSPFEPTARVYLGTAAATVSEGDAGGTPVVFSVNLRTATSEPVTVDFSTQDGSASAGADYVLAGGTLSLSPGQTNQTFAVSVLGDRMDETNETFFVKLLNASGASIMTVPAGLTILDDDPPPALFINDVSVMEGDAGTNDAVFTVSLSAPSGLLVRARYATANGTATAGNDYLAASSAVLSFPPGTTNQTAVVRALGDTLTETNETFFVNLSSPSNATIGDGQGLGTIVDDDFRLVAVASNGPDFTISFTTIAGRLYRIERTENLATPIAWESVPGATNVPGTGVPVQIIDAGGVGQSQRFYRIRLN